MGVPGFIHLLGLLQFDFPKPRKIASTMFIWGKWVFCPIFSLPHYHNPSLPCPCWARRGMICPSIPFNIKKKKTINRSQVRLPWVVRTLLIPLLGCVCSLPHLQELHCAFSTEEWDSLPSPPLCQQLLLNSVHKGKSSYFWSPLSPIGIP